MLSDNYYLFLEIGQYLLPTDLTNLQKVNRGIHRLFQGETFWSDLLYLKTGFRFKRITRKDYHIFYYLFNLPDNFECQEDWRKVEIDAWSSQKSTNFWLYKDREKLLTGKSGIPKMMILARTSEGAFLKLRWFQNNSRFLRISSDVQEGCLKSAEKISRCLECLGDSYEVYSYHLSKHYEAGCENLKFFRRIEEYTKTKYKYFQVHIDVFEEDPNILERQVATFLKNKFFRARSSQGAILEVHRVIQENFPSISFVEMLFEANDHNYMSVSRCIEVINEKGFNWFIRHKTFIETDTIDGKTVDIRTFTTIFIFVEMTEQLEIF